MFLTFALYLLLSRIFIIPLPAILINFLAVPRLPPYL
jgi:hypothetical protein